LVNSIWRPASCICAISLKASLPPGLPFEPLRADDAPAYFTIAIVGHVVVSGLLALETFVHPPTWVQLAIWLPLTLVMTLGLLPYIKGAVMAAIFCANRSD